MIVFSSACAGLAGEKISLQRPSYVIFIEMIQFFCNETISCIKNSFLIIISSFHVSQRSVSYLNMNLIRLPSQWIGVS